MSGAVGAPVGAPPDSCCPAPAGPDGLDRLTSATGPLGLPWALIVLLGLGGALRFCTLDLQSLWYDEAFLPVHVLHRGLGATLRSMAHTENTPPLYYVLDWGWSRALGTSAVALRSLSALAGLGTVGVAWAIGSALHSRRAALITSALVAVSPMLVWYSQEARAYSLFALLGSLSFLFFLRALEDPTSGRVLARWAVASALALGTHYFAVFTVAPEAIVLLALAAPRRARLIAVGALGAVGIALAPLAISQGGHGAQWIGRWALSSRLVAIPQYFLFGASGPVLGHALLLLALVPVALALVLATRLDPGSRRRALLAGTIGAAGILAPLILALTGPDYLAPRNLILSLVPLTAAVAVVLAAGRPATAGVVLAAILGLSGLAAVAAVDLRPRLQRGDWRTLAPILGPASTARAVVTAQLGSAPLSYYRPGLHRVRPRSSLSVSEVDLVGYRPLVGGAGRPPAPGLTLIGRRDVHGLIALRFQAAAPVAVTERQLLTHRITRVRSQVLAGG